jgi:hypothetical protein
VGLKKAVMETTLSRFVYDTTISAELVIEKLLVRKPPFPPVLEAELPMESKYYGLTWSGLLSLTYLLVIVHRINRPSDTTNSEMAVCAWFLHFQRRQKKSLSPQKSTGTSDSRTSGVNIVACTPEEGTLLGNS